jgi:diaminopimelate decarboxylase
MSGNAKLTYERPVLRKLQAGMPNKFGTRTAYEPMTHIDGVPVAELAERFGSPLFVFSERRIRENYRRALRAFTLRYPKVQFAWSYKTNYLNALCRVFHQEGSWGEVVSRFEFDKALANGVPGHKILFNGPDKTDDDLRVAMAHDAPIHIDHLDELYRLTALAEAADLHPRVAIRVNMDTGIYPMWDRFGFNYENGQAWDALNKIVSKGRLKLIGLHAHIGTFMLSPQAYGVAAAKLADLALGLEKKHGVRVEYLDLGGGFPSTNTLKGSFLSGADTAPPVEDFAEAIASALLGAGFDKDALPALYLETGRALIDDAGYLVGEVIASKRLSDGRRATILDFGVNVLFTAFWYNHPMLPAQPFGQHTEDTVCYGPLCMNIDVVREHVTLPPMQAGDRVVVTHVGAYNVTQSMQFINLRPAVVLIDPEGNAHEIRRREGIEALQREESVPAHLAEHGLAAEG